MSDLVGVIVAVVVVAYPCVLAYKYLTALEENNGDNALVKWMRRRNLGKPLTKKQDDYLDKVQDEAELPKDYVDSLKYKDEENK